MLYFFFPFPEWRHSMGREQIRRKGCIWPYGHSGSLSNKANSSDTGGPGPLFPIAVPWLAHLHHPLQNSQRNTNWRQASHAADHPGPLEPSPSAKLSPAGLAAEPRGARLAPKHPQATDSLRLPSASQIAHSMWTGSQAEASRTDITYRLPPPQCHLSRGPVRDFHCVSGQGKDERTTTFHLVAANFL